MAPSWALLAPLPAPAPAALWAPVPVGPPAQSRSGQLGGSQAILEGEMRALVWLSMTSEII